MGQEVMALKEGRGVLDIRKRLITMKVVKHWNKLPREVTLSWEYLR